MRTTTSALSFYISRLISTREELLIILLACLISKFSCSCLGAVSSPSAHADGALTKPGPQLAEATMVTLGETYEPWICSSLSAGNKIITDFLSYCSAFRSSPCTSEQDLALCVWNKQQLVRVEWAEYAVTVTNLASFGFLGFHPALNIINWAQIGGFFANFLHF